METAKTQPSLNSLIFEVCHGPVWKRGRAIVAGILNHHDPIGIIASIGRPVTCYDTRASRKKSSLIGGLSAFALPKRPRNTEFLIDDDTPVDDVAVLFLLEDVPLPCMSFLPGATIVGTEARLREALKGQKFLPRARWGELAAMEIQ